MQDIYKATMKAIINKQGDKLYRRLGLTPGFSLEDTVKRLGGVIEKKELDKSIYAEIMPIENNTNFKISYTQQPDLDSYVRFSIAHELGHLFLHMAQRDEQGNDVFVGNYTRQLENKSKSLIEWEAEEFAAAFLMPETVFKEKVDEVEANETIDDKIQWLADEFDVPYKSVITRGKSLEIW